jgi:hypothetical protein
MTGTLALSWGPYGGFYLHPRRVCLGWVALTYVRPEMDDLMEAYVQRDQMTDALASIRIYSEAGQDGTHKSWGEACGEDACLICLIEGTAAEAIAITTNQKGAE